MPIKLGRYSYIAKYRESFSPDVEVGNFTSIASNIVFHGNDNHPVYMVSTSPFFHHFPELNLPNTNWSKGKIIIGNDVWIGDDVSIMGGVKIGNGSIVAAHSVVTKNVPPYAIAAGNPARVKGFRFKSDIVLKLLKIAWWNWSDEKIKENISWFLGDVKDFINKFIEEVE